MMNKANQVFLSIFLNNLMIFLKLKASKINKEKKVIKSQSGVSSINEFSTKFVSKRYSTQYIKIRTGRAIRAIGIKTVILSFKFILFHD